MVYSELISRSEPFGCYSSFGRNAHLTSAALCAHTSPNQIALSGYWGVENMPARTKTSTPRFLPVVIGLMAIAAIATSCSDDQLHPELVPGTAYVKSAGNPPWFTISPDEQWIAFMEVDSTEWDTPEFERPPGSFHLVMMSLETHRKTHYSLSDLPKGTFTAPFPAWMEVQIWFVTRGWLDDRLYVQLRTPPTRRPWIRFTPGEVLAERAEPPAELSCCACGPVRDYPGVLKARGIGGRSGYWTGTAAYRDGKFSKTIYASPILNENGAVNRVNNDGSVERIFEEKRRFREVDASGLLVSPDERFLAIVLTTNVRSPIPLPTMRYELHVLDFHSGEHLRVGGSYRLMGDLMWSEDSRRLYYAAVNGPVADGKGDGIFRISFQH